MTLATDRVTVERCYLLIYLHKRMSLNEQRAPSVHSVFGHCWIVTRFLAIFPFGLC